MSATKKGKKTRKPLIILTAGGTGGHVYPAEALADELLRRGYRVELITDSRGKDNYKGRLGEITNHAVLAGALVGKSRLCRRRSAGRAPDFQKETRMCHRLRRLRFFPELYGGHSARHRLGHS